MGTSPPRIRVAIAVAGLAAAAAIALCARAVGEGLAPEPAEALDRASDGLALVGAMFAANWIVAWIYRSSWPVTVARCLVFAVVAYVGVSELVDLFGENRDVAWQILGADPPADAAAVAGLRARGLSWLCVTGLAALAIGFGFEPRGS